MAADEVSPRAYAPILSSGTVTADQVPQEAVSSINFIGLKNYKGPKRNCANGKMVQE